MLSGMAIAKLNFLAALGRMDVRFKKKKKRWQEAAWYGWEAIV